MSGVGRRSEVLLKEAHDEVEEHAASKQGEEAAGDPCEPEQGRFHAGKCATRTECHRDEHIPDQNDHELPRAVEREGYRFGG